MATRANPMPQGPNGNMRNMRGMTAMGQTSFNRRNLPSRGVLTGARAGMVMNEEGLPIRQAPQSLRVVQTGGRR